MKLFTVFTKSYMSTDTKFLKKYSQIIAEEVNVKEVHLLWWDTQFKQTYSPVGRELSADFGKDTWRIIWAAKSWNAVLNSDGTLTVLQWNDSWTLQPHQFENRVEWLDESHQTAESGVVVSLDFELTDELIAEWVAREISRFLNQMRKDADYQIDARVACSYQTDSKKLQSVLHTFSDFLQAEALLSQIQVGSGEYDSESLFESEEGTITFQLKK